MSTIHLNREENTNKVFLQNKLEKKEQVNDALLQYLENTAVPSIFPVLYNNQKRNRYLQIELTSCYSIATRLTDPVSASEALLLLKGVYDSLGEVTAHNIPLNYVDLSIDRAFITPEGTIRWVLWGIEPYNEQTTLDLFYNIAQTMQPRSQSDVALIQEYQSLFSKKYTDMSTYLTDIEGFIKTNYENLEAYLLDKYQEKGHEVQGGNADTLALQAENDRLKRRLEAKDRELKRLKQDVQEDTSEPQVTQVSQQVDTSSQPTDSQGSVSDSQQGYQTAGAGTVPPVEQRDAQPTQQSQVSQPVQSTQQSQASQPVQATQQPINQPQVQQPDLQTMIAQAVAAAMQSAQTQQQPMQQQPVQQPQVYQPPHATTDVLDATSVLTDEVYTEADKQRMQHTQVGVFDPGNSTTVLIDDLEESSGKHPYLVRVDDPKDATPLKDGLSIVGRRRSTSDIFVSNSNTVSTRHALINYNSNTNEITIVDESRNGTWVNGERVVHNLEKNIFENDIIAFAGEEYKLEYRKGG